MCVTRKKRTQQLIYRKQNWARMATLILPFYLIIFDGQMKRRNMTKENQNYDYHWVNHRVVINRVLANNLDQSRKNVLDVWNIKLLPTVQDQKHQRYNYIVLVARMLVEHFDFFKSFKDVCVQHIPHKYSKELSKKSESVSMLLL